MGAILEAGLRHWLAQKRSTGSERGWDAPWTVRDSTAEEPAIDPLPGGPGNDRGVRTNDPARSQEGPALAILAGSVLVPLAPVCHSAGWVTSWQERGAPEVAPDIGHPS